MKARTSRPEVASRSPEKPRKCPKCGSDKVADILWGYPVEGDAALEAAIRKKRVTLGGCTVSDDDPVWECTSCGEKGGRRRSRISRS